MTNVRWNRVFALWLILLSVFAVWTLQEARKSHHLAEQAKDQAGDAEWRINQLEEDVQPALEQIRQNRAAKMRDAGFYVTQVRNDRWCVAQNATVQNDIPQTPSRDYERIGGSDSTYIVEKHHQWQFTPAICAFDSKGEAQQEIGTEELIEAWKDRFSAEFLPSDFTNNSEGGFDEK